MTTWPEYIERDADAVTQLLWRVVADIAPEPQYAGCYDCVSDVVWDSGRHQLTISLEDGAFLWLLRCRDPDATPLGGECTAAEELRAAVAPWLHLFVEGRARAVLASTLAEEVSGG